MEKLIFDFDLEKAIEVTALLRKLHGSSILGVELLQMLYLIDRCSIRDTGYPIIGGTYVTHSNSNFTSILIEEVYQPLFWSHKLPPNVKEEQFNWKEYFSFNPLDKERLFLDLLKDPGNQNLSEREEEQIRFVYETIRYLGLGSSTFTFPEWEHQPYFLSLDVVDLLKTLGKTEEEIEEIKSTITRERYLNSRKLNETC